DLPSLFKELFRVLKPNGLLLFTTFGLDTLLELRQSWAAVDSKTHVHPFVDMHDMGDELLRAKFSDPVMDMEMLQVTYSDVLLIMKDLKALGAHNMSMTRNLGLTGKDRLKACISAYEKFRDMDGQLPVSYEVVYGHAWKPKTSLNSEFRISVDKIKRVNSNESDAE
ncbi:MAG: hypothetical protein JSS53_10530, partial [Proteobacteria bacterium]|nr:hypothetical protein [Pseudomonadota bacterium]